MNGPRSPTFRGFVIGNFITLRPNVRKTPEWLKIPWNTSIIMNCGPSNEGSNLGSRFAVPYIINDQSQCDYRVIE